MSYVIADPCIDHMDQSCVDVCPVDCISADPTIDRKFYIDPDGCIDCGSCEAACPNAAIFRVDRLPTEWLGYALIDATFHRDPAAARASVDALLPAA
ncbi:MAG: 4Fe-4S dicluster domain-containing protein [Candidatus Limnocylindria bacterium]